MTPERDCVKEALYSKRRVCSKVAGGNAGVKRVRGVYFRSNFQPTDGVESVTSRLTIQLRNSKGEGKASL